jgi:hypothetical protein
LTRKRRISFPLPSCAAGAAQEKAEEWGGKMGRPLTIFSVRPEPMRGAQDLIPVVRRLAEGNVGFTLVGFGIGLL